MGQGIRGIIKVEDFEFYIAKGWYESEHKVENHFKVSAEVHYDKDRLPSGTFLDYVDIVDILRSHMISDVHLLETVAESILADMAAKWPFIDSARVRIRKLMPAITGMKIGALVVEMEKDFKTGK